MRRALLASLALLGAASSARAGDWFVLTNNGCKQIARPEYDDPTPDGVARQLSRDGHHYTVNYQQHDLLYLDDSSSSPGPSVIVTQGEEKCVEMWGGAATPAQKQTYQAHQTSRFADLALISLSPGPNRVRNFGPDGSAALILQARHHGAKGGTSTVWITTVQGEDGWDIVQVRTGGAPLDSLADAAPEQGLVRAVRFARGRFDGRKGSFLLLAAREVGAAGGDGAAPTYFEAYALSEDAPYRFERVLQMPLADKYCDAEKALRVGAGLARADEADTGCGRD